MKGQTVSDITLSDWVLSHVQQFGFSLLALGTETGNYNSCGHLEEVVLSRNLAFLQCVTKRKMFGCQNFSDGTGIIPVVVV